MRLNFLTPAHLQAAPRLLHPGLRLPEGLKRELPSVWAQLLEDGRMRGMAIEDAAQPPGSTLVGIGMSAFLAPDFAAEYLRRPCPYPAAIVYEAIRDGQSVLLPESGLSRYSEARDLTLLVLHYGQHPWLDHPRGLAILGMGHAAFRLSHEGYGIGRIFQEAYGAQQQEFLRAGGMLLKSDYAEHRAAAGSAAAPALEPALMGLTREDPESRLPGTTCSFLFQRSAPRLRFSPAEQRVLLRALVLESDALIAEQLHLSPNTLKKIWRSIYDRAGSVDRSLTDPDARSPATVAETAVRGRERRRRLIEYLRLHMEELRPFPRTGAGRS